jgi:Mrp family chromosome partitioning ATPase
MNSAIQERSESPVQEGFEQILGHLDAARQRSGRARVLAIAGCRGGDGATFVLRELAKRLAKRSRRGVLQADCADLISASHLNPGELLDQCSFTREAGLWLLSSPDRRFRFADASGESDVQSAMMVLRSRFDYILLDCGAVNVSGGIWQVASIVEDVFLVVAAGATTRDQVSYAQRIIAQSGAPLTGCILNKRTYPLPNVIHRLLH